MADPKQVEYNQRSLDKKRNAGYVRYERWVTLPEREKLENLLKRLRKA